MVNSELITGFLNVRSEGFGILKVGNDILKNFCQAYFELCEFHRCPEGAEIGSRQLIVEFFDLNVDFLGEGLFKKIIKMPKTA